MEKKNRSLEAIQEKVNDEFQKKYTFTPNIEKSKNQNIAKRNLGQFLEDQANHKKKIQEKLNLLKEAKIKEKMDDCQSTPKINEISKRLAEEKNKTENIGNSVHDRLYNKRNLNAKSSILKQSPSNFNKNNTSKKLDERTKILYQDAVNRHVKQKQIENITKQKEKKTAPKSNDNSNKFIFKKFKNQYKQEVEKLLNDIANNNDGNNSQKQANKLNYNQLITLMQNLNFISKDVTENTTNDEEIINDNNRLATKNMEKKLLLDLYDNIKDNNGQINLDHLFLFCLSILNLLEYYIIKAYKHNAKNRDQNNKDEQINNNLEENLDGKNLPNSYSQKTLKNSSSNARIIKKNNSTAALSDDALLNLAHKLNLDLNGRIILHKKYGGLDEENNFIISFTHAKLIFKDFNPFILNWNSTNRNKPKKKIPKNLLNEQPTFKPNINPKSVQLSNKFRIKVLNEIESHREQIDEENDQNEMTNHNNLNNVSELKRVSSTQDIKLNKNKDEFNIHNNENVENSRPRQQYFSPRHQQRSNNLKSPKKNEIDYIEAMNLKKKKQEKMNEKIREEKQLKELENCTFKPKINEYKFRENVINVVEGTNIPLTREQRIDQLYKKGTEFIMGKKNKTKDDYEIEKYGKECTFKPNINERDIDGVFERASNLRKDKDIERFNERMKRGRIEKEIKESIFRRGEEIISPHKYNNNNNNDPNLEKARNKSEGKQFTFGINQNGYNKTNFNDNESNSKIQNNINKYYYQKDLNETVNKKSQYLSQVSTDNKNSSNSSGAVSNNLSKSDKSKIIIL